VEYSFYSALSSLSSQFCIGQISCSSSINFQVAGGLRNPLEVPTILFFSRVATYPIASKILYSSYLSGEEVNLMKRYIISIITVMILLGAIFTGMVYGKKPLGVAVLCVG